MTKENFEYRIEKEKFNQRFKSGAEQYAWGLYRYLHVNNIHERKDIIKVMKNWFLTGNNLAVNGSASGRVVLKYEPELLYLLKIGFIKRSREQRYSRKTLTKNKNFVGRKRVISGKTYLVLNDSK